MCDGIVIEGHILPKMRDELVGESGSMYEIIKWMTGNCSIAITDHIEAHWRTHCSERDLFFWTWFGDQVKNNVIHYIKPRKIDSDIRKRIHDDYGLPRASFGRAYLECAHGTKEPRYILSEDIDLHDPKARRSSTETRISIKESRFGSLCHYLEKRLHIRVGTITDCKRLFPINRNPCSHRTIIHKKQCPCIP